LIGQKVTTIVDTTIKKPAGFWIINGKKMETNNLVLDPRRKKVHYLDKEEVKEKYGINNTYAISMTVDIDSFFNSKENVLKAYGLKSEFKKLPFYIDKKECIADSAILIQKNIIKSVDLITEKKEDGFYKYIRIATNYPVYKRSTSDSLRVERIKSFWHDSIPANARIR